MYFFSGDETCLKEMPACFVISVKRIPGGAGLPNPADTKSGKITRGARNPTLLDGKRITPYGELRIRLTALFLFQPLRNLQLVLPILLASRCKIGPAKLIMNIRTFGLQLGRDFQLLNRSFYVTLGQQRLAEFIVRLGVIRLKPNHFSHLLNAALSLLVCQQNKAQMIFRPQVT